MLGAGATAGAAGDSADGRPLLLLRAKGRSAVGLGACWALARRLARQATRRSRRWCPGGIIVCLSLAHSVATTVRDDDGGGADDGVLAALSAFSRSLGGNDGDDGGSVDDGARRQRGNRRRRPGRIVVCLSLARRRLRQQRGRLRTTMAATERTLVSRRHCLPSLARLLDSDYSG